MLENFQDDLLDNMVLRGVKNIERVIPKITDTLFDEDGVYKKKKLGSWIR